MLSDSVGIFILVWAGMKVVSRPIYLPVGRGTVHRQNEQTQRGVLDVAVFGAHQLETIMKEEVNV
jgi:hypothetical protein